MDYDLGLWDRLCGGNSCVALADQDRVFVYLGTFCGQLLIAQGYTYFLLNSLA